jgi:hypothetical protein
MEWDAKELSLRLLHQAEAAERYLNEARAKARVNTSYERIVDEQLGKFYALNHFAVSTSLETRDSFLRGLRNYMQDKVAPGSEAFDVERFERARRGLLQQMIDDHSKVS